MNVSLHSKHCLRFVLLNPYIYCDILPSILARVNVQALDWVAIVSEIRYYNVLFNGM